MLVWLMMLPITQLASKKFQVDVRGKESSYLFFLMIHWSILISGVQDGSIQVLYIVCMFCVQKYF